MDKGLPINLETIKRVPMDEYTYDFTAAALRFLGRGVKVVEPSLEEMIEHSGTTDKDGGKEIGGVDFRATLTAAQVNPANTPAITAAMISQIATQASFQVKDLAAVQKQLVSRINKAQTAQELPVQELKECLAVCSTTGEQSADTAEQITVCLMNILQQEEARGLESPAQVQELLSFAEACQA